MHRESSKSAMVTFSPFNLPSCIQCCRRSKLTGWYFLACWLTKPRLGKRFTSGVWPPSNQGRGGPLPERAFWPLWPRPAVLPLPYPGPLPTRSLYWAKKSKRCRALGCCAAVCGSMGRREWDVYLSYSSWVVGKISQINRLWGWNNFTVSRQESQWLAWCGIGSNCAALQTKFCELCEHGVQLQPQSCNSGFRINFVHLVNIIEFTWCDCFLFYCFIFLLLQPPIVFTNF